MSSTQTPTQTSTQTQTQTPSQTQTTTQTDSNTVTITQSPLDLQSIDIPTWMWVVGGVLLLVFVLISLFSIYYKFKMFQAHPKAALGLTAMNTVGSFFGRR